MKVQGFLAMEGRLGQASWALDDTTKGPKVYGQRTYFFTGA